MFSTPERVAAEVHLFDRTSFSLLGSLGQWVLHSKLFFIIFFFFFHRAEESLELPKLTGKHV